MTAVFAVTPLISNFLFMTRRTNNGFDNVKEGRTLPVALANFNIAAGQTYKGYKAAVDIMSDSAKYNNLIKGATTSAEQSIKSLSLPQNIVKGAGKVVQFTADHINPMIGVASGIKVLCSDDKVDAAVREGLAIGIMFSSEATAKKFLGMPQFLKYDPNKMLFVNGDLYKVKKGSRKLIARKKEYAIKNNNITVKKEELFKNLFSDKQKQAIKQTLESNRFCKKYMNYLPGIAKGLCFVTASICGYKLGAYIADKILENRTNKKSKNKNN